MRIQVLFATPLALLSLIAVASAAEVGGKYAVQGTNFDGSKYGGSVEILVSSNTTCRIVWHIGSGTSKGICMRVNDTFVAGYTLKGAVGLVSYQIKPDGTLDGIWTIADQDGAGTEVLVPAK